MKRDKEHPRRRAAGRGWWLASLAVAAGCTGLIGDAPTGDGPIDSDQNAFVCDAAKAQSETLLKRLTYDQYRNTLRDLLQPLGDGEADAVMAALQAPLTIVPGDVRNALNDYVQMDDNVSQSHVDGYYAVARAFGEQVTSTPQRVTDFVGACASDADTGNDAACVDELIARFGRRALRRPLTSDEQAFFRDEIYNVDGPLDMRGVVDVIAALLMAPPFTFRIENGNAAVDGDPNLYRLTGYELASRLSYHFWHSMPDEALLLAAENGELDSDEGYAAEVERVFKDPRTRRAIDQFYAQWLQLDDVPDMTEAVDRPDFQAFAGSDLPGADFREHMIEDAQDLLRYYTWLQPDGSFSDFFLSDLSFAKTADLAAIYGDVPLWTEGSEPQSLPAGTRAGILTRPALVANNKKTTRPIMKGSLIRKRLLCDKLELPDNMMNMMSNLDADNELSTRQRVEALTEQPGSFCASCHIQLNPLGFSTESYDALGRHRSEETLYDSDGNVIATVPVDTESVPYVTSGDDRVAKDSFDLAEYIVESGKAHACFARHYFRFSYGRAENDKVDGCALEDLRQRLIDNGSIHDMLRDVALQSEFRTRKKGQ